MTEVDSTRPDVALSRTTCKRSWVNLVTHFEEFCAKSSLHGLQYIGDSHRPVAERVIWVLTWVFSMALGGVLIAQVYHKWDTSPVIVSLSPSETPIWQIPFPAVTVCDNTRARASLFNYTDVVLRQRQQMPLTDWDQFCLDVVSAMCVNTTSIKIGNLTADDDFVETLEALGTGSHMFELTIDNGEIANHTEVFQPVMTQDGICYTFNMLNHQDIHTDDVHIDSVLNQTSYRSAWTMSSSYGKDSEGAWTYPSRALKSGVRRGLRLYLKSRAEEHDYLCQYQGQGFKVMLHNPGEIPDTNRRFVNVAPNREVQVAVSPNMITTHANLKNYSPERYTPTDVTLDPLKLLPLMLICLVDRRKCYLPGDHQLRFYREYTQSKCNLECLTNITFAICQCVAFYMPSEWMFKNGTYFNVTSVKLDLDRESVTGTADMKICVDESQRECILNMREIVAILKEADINEEIQKTEDKTYGDVTCNCLPACTDLTYDLVTSTKTLDVQGLSAAYSLNISDTTSLAAVVIYFNTDQFIGSQRSELFGVTEFIAYSGGLLGLFLGFSILSLCEITYFLSLRACHNLCKRDAKLASVT